MIAQWAQPIAVQYDSFDPYSLSIVEKGTDYSSILNWRPACEVFVGRGTNIDYGHAVAFSFYPGSTKVDTFIRASTVSWSADGVTLIVGSGHRLFIPKAKFIGGR